MVTRASVIAGSDVFSRIAPAVVLNATGSRIAEALADHRDSQ
jgi:hypothetical protein